MAKEYLYWDEKNITDFSDSNLNSLYNQGYVFTRRGKGVMHQTRSLRIDLSKFELSSENRRILRKTKMLHATCYMLHEYPYHWSIGKIGHDFYENKFGHGTFSANKIKELMTDQEKSNFNRLFVYHCDHPTSPAGLGDPPSKGGDSVDVVVRPLSPPLEGGVANPPEGGEAGVVNRKTPPWKELAPRNSRGGAPSPQAGGVVDTVGYAIALETEEILHYSYPFYDLSNVKSQLSNVGLGMMLRAILYAQDQKKKYVYIGSAQRPTDTYKLQFAGLEWFDGKQWQKDMTVLKMTINTV